MVKLGFENEQPEEIEFTDEQSAQSKVDSIKKKIEKQNLSIYIPEERRIEFLKEYEYVAVNDFGDSYHLSEEEMKKRNANYEVFSEFRKVKHKYRKVDQFVDAMREALKVLDFIAEHNGVFDPLKFKKKFMRGDIEIVGLYLPKFIGKEKKYMSMDFLSEFILSDEPSSELLKKPDEIFTDEELKDKFKVLFTKEEIEKILEEPTEDEIIKDACEFDPDDEKERYERNIAYEITKKELKNILKEHPDFIKVIKDSKTAMTSIANLGSRFAYDITEDDFEFLERYDRKKMASYSKGVMPKFKGSIMKDKDFDRYMLELEEWENDNVYEDYHGKNKSLSEIEDIEFKTKLEEYGYNIRNLYDNKKVERKVKQQIKRDKKREEKLKQRLLDIQKRRKMTDSKDILKQKKKMHKAKKKQKKDMDKLISSTSSTDKSVLDWSQI